MSAMIKSKKYKGVYHRQRKDGDVTYYFTYQNEDNKTQFQKVGLKSSGITETYVDDLRTRTILSLRNNELPPKIVNKTRYDTKVDDIAEVYFSSHKTVSTEKRHRQYNNRLKSYFGHMCIYNVTTEHIEKYKQKMLSEVSPHTTIMYLELLSTIYNYYIKQNGVKISNPLLNVKKPRIDNKRERFLSKDEINTLLDEISNDFTLTLFVALSLSTAGRKGTVLNYSVKDVDLSHSMITSEDIKNGSTYKSFLDERTIELVKIRIKQSTNPNDKLVYNPNIIDLDRWISRSLKIVFDNLFNIGLEADDRKNRVVIHSLRHTVLSHLGMKGCNQFVLRKISNHQSLSMLNRYVKLDGETGRKEIEMLWK
ncbi:MAG: site-specific integrase [Sulfuricurvum sp.]|uniref:tyrosine-type recombinase/integrase n=1 Tax=Sulfuricurvum sp. TaxID=2025608 RepID=UPI002637031F|nr:site-specific integrase [Sulfuricurvum sp.]MDD2369507.1 site-specific integrase [Sulfuricurvum sp.]MDD5117009.1 site-specific integrase [Sulfuricurvum sp.]